MISGDRGGRLDLIGAAATTSLYLATAAGLICLVSKTVRPIRSRTALILAVLPLVITGRGVLTGRVFGPIDLHHSTPPLSEVADEYGIDGTHAGILWDIAGQKIPWRAAVRYAYANGEWPLMNPFILCGHPLAGGAQAAPYAVPELISLLLPEDLAAGYVASFTLLAAAIGAFLLCRELHCRDPAALVGAAAWMLNGFLTFWLPWTMGATVAWLPWILAAVTRLCRRPTVGRAIWLSGLFVVTWLAGHPESMFHLVIVGGIWACVELIPSRRRVTAVVFGTGAGLVALGLTAFSILPVLDTVDQSVAHAFRSQELATKTLALPVPQSLDRMRLTIVPFLYGVPEGERVSNDDLPPQFNPFPWAWVGAVLLGPAILGIPGLTRRRRLFFLGVGFIGLLVGASFPFVTDGLQQLPGFDISLNQRLIFLVSLALSVFGAVGVDRTLRSGRWRPLLWVEVSTLVLIAGSLTLWSDDMVASGFSEAFIWNRAAMMLLPVAALALTTAWSRNAALSVSVLFLLLVAERTVESGNIHPTFERAAFFPVVEPLDSLPDSGEPFRVVGTYHVLIPNISAMYRFEDLRGNVALHLQAADPLRPLWSIPDQFFDRVTNLSRPLLDVMGVRFAFVQPPHGAPPGWKEIARGNGVRLFENPDAFPRAFIPDQAIINPTVNTMRRAYELSRGFRKRVWLYVPTLPAVPQRHVNGPGTVSAERAGTGLLLHANVEKESWVVVTNSAWRGWRAFTDGRELEVVAANHAFLAIRVPAGSHTVRLVFRPRSFELGLAISLGTVIVLFLVWLVFWLKGRWRVRLSKP